MDTLLSLKNKIIYIHTSNNYQIISFVLKNAAINHKRSDSNNVSGTIPLMVSSVCNLNLLFVCLFDFLKSLDVISLEPQKRAIYFLDSLQEVIYR